MTWYDAAQAWGGIAGASVVVWEVGRRGLGVFTRSLNGQAPPPELRTALMEALPLAKMARVEPVSSAWATEHLTPLARRLHDLADVTFTVKATRANLVAARVQQLAIQLDSVTWGLERALVSPTGVTLTASEHKSRAEKTVKLTLSILKDLKAWA